MNLDEERVLPNNPLEFIKECILHRKILWTYHVNMQMRKRAISRQQVLGAATTYEIIEQYPDDKYLPSYLVYAQLEEAVLHILFAVDVPGKNVRVITAYYPDPSYWNENLKSRRKQ